VQRGNGAAIDNDGLIWRKKLHEWLGDFHQWLQPSAVYEILDVSMIEMDEIYVVRKNLPNDTGLPLACVL